MAEPGGDGIRDLIFERENVGQFPVVALAAAPHLRVAIEARDPIVMPIKTFPFLDPIRKDARFRALLGKMNLA